MVDQPMGGGVGQGEKGPSPGSKKSRKGKGGDRKKGSKATFELLEVRIPEEGKSDQNKHVSNNDGKRKKKKRERLVVKQGEG